MQQFEITLQNEKIKSYRSIAFIILLLNLAVFIFLLFYDQYRYEAASAILLIGVYIFMRLYFIRKYNQGNYLDQVMLFVLAGCWLGLGNYFIVASLVILGILYHLALQKLQFVFTKEKIAANVIVEESPVIVMNSEDRIHLDRTLLHDYILNGE